MPTVQSQMQTRRGEPAASIITLTHYHASTGAYGNTTTTIVGVRWLICIAIVTDVCGAVVEAMSKIQTVGSANQSLYRNRGNAVVSPLRDTVALLLASFPFY
eukprot:TRINITY_DN1103_c0_g1_i1.p2 TRINITY_DN1103_c0_g1~~TRINITY_DN1103_c0_g1_i1.p2  ORF type:complete len:102 (+),score=11.50 TRINITY_DN1103_c0_g1_i1:270-575(+)